MEGVGCNHGIGRSEGKVCERQSLIVQFWAFLTVQGLGVSPETENVPFYGFLGPVFRAQPRRAAAGPCARRAAAARPSFEAQKLCFGSGQSRGPFLDSRKGAFTNVAAEV